LEKLPEAGGRWAGLTQPDRGELATEEGLVRWEAIPLQDDSGNTLGVFGVANFVEAERQEIADAINTALAVAAAILLLAAVVGWIAAARILRPIRHVTDTARAIGETDLSRRIDVEGRDEVADLARTFNAMLDRLETAFATQRAFVDDAGHELRTPITIVRGQLELLSDDPEQRRRAIELATGELDRMSRMVNDLLLLAKAQQPDLLELDLVEIGDLTRGVSEKGAVLGDRRWRLDAVADGGVVGDRQRLEQALIELLKNAVDHTETEDEIGLGSEISGGRARFWVRDTGAGIPPEMLEHVFERFSRGGPHRTDGAGLGLSIARAIAEAHGGRLQVESELGAGTTFTIEVPVDQEPRAAP